ncbi:hypothetical protein EEL33_04190 [Muribaculaceae bacterium Isolate-037 (Harlan)]|nr:hypothetical protein EEL33_04190 [Muribaculaceae bacterium Isolate-037 (Harlan)]
MMVVISACQKPYEKTITQNVDNLWECYNQISISEPVPDLIDSTMWMPKHQIATYEPNYRGPVKVVEHIFTTNAERTDTVKELWVFDDDMERVIFISQE